MSHAIDISGQTFGRLTVTARAPCPSGRDGAWWTCQCDCGQTALAKGAEIRSGHKTSCGCTKERRGFFVGGKIPAEHRVWTAMRARCNNPKSKDFKHYGGRGITVCERWSTYGAFIDDMGPRPSSKHQIERQDNNAGYSPDNCVWATKVVQARNTRRVRTVTLDGVEMSIREYADALGIPYQTAVSRLRTLRSNEVQK